LRFRRWCVVPGDQVPANDELVTAVFQVKHGAGASIFATVRGLLTRDTNRIGNILYVQGPERIILVDLASKVRYYREVIEQLDVPAAGPATATHIIQLQFADVTRVANVLWNLHPQTQAAAPAQGQPVVVAPAASGVPPLRITYDARTNQLLLSGPAEQLPAIERVVKALDVQVAERQTSVVIKTFEAKGEPREVSNALSELLYSLEQANAIRLRPRVTVVGRRLVVVVHGSDVARVEEALKVVDP
jgi:type II secretory pathway component GspD/PulD (secretin)